jgi:hypothetical protein
LQPNEFPYRADLLWDIRREFGFSNFIHALSSLAPPRSYLFLPEFDLCGAGDLLFSLGTAQQIPQAASWFCIHWTATLRPEG